MHLCAAPRGTTSLLTRYVSLGESLDHAAGQVSSARASLTYGTPTFQAATVLARDLADRGRLRGAVSAVIRRPRGTLAVVRTVRNLPVVEVEVTPDHLATWLSECFGPTAGAIFGGHRAQAVLDLTADQDAYLAGRRMQALRTNLRHARRLGVDVTQPATFEEWTAVAREVLVWREGGPELLQQMQPPPPGQPMAYFVATAADARPVAHAGLAVFNNFAVLFTLLSRPSHEAASSARYMLHTAIRQDLHTRGIRYLVVGSAIREQPGLQYFQYLLGYEVRNLRITLGVSHVGALQTSRA